jgi:hypothetical protein
MRRREIPIVWVASNTGTGAGINIITGINKWSNQGERFATAMEHA